MSEPWVCFHCGFSSADRIEAAGHFGEFGDEFPICLTWAKLNADDRLQEYQNITGELNREREENLRMRSQIEGLEYRLYDFEILLGSRFKGCKTINDAFNLYDSMEGRALAAEEKCSKL